MDFTTQARQAIYATLSPEAALSPGSTSSLLASSAPQPQAFSPLAYHGVLSPSALDSSASYSELVAAARAAVASLPAHPLPRLAGADGSPQRAAALLSELDLAMQRLHSLRGAAASLEAQRRVSPTSARLASSLLASSALPPSPPRAADAAAALPARLAASDLGSSRGSQASPASPQQQRLLGASYGLLRTSLSASAERLQAATEGLSAAAAAASTVAAAAAASSAAAAAASAAAAAAAASPAALPRRRPSPGLTPQWLERTALASPAPSSSSAAPSPAPHSALAAARAAALFSSPMAATPASRKRSLPTSPIHTAAAVEQASPAAPPEQASTPAPPAAWAHLEDAHASQRCAEALYLAASDWRASHHTAEVLENPLAGVRLVTHALRASGVAGEEEAAAEGQPRSSGTDAEQFIASLCTAAGLEVHQQDQLLARVQALARTAVACTGLNAFAGRVTHQLSARLVGLGEAWEAGGGVRYGPLRHLVQEQQQHPQQQPWGPAYCSMSQAEALLDSALSELSAHRVLRAHGRS
jgi:hypothetical protein